MMILRCLNARVLLWAVMVTTCASLGACGFVEEYQRHMDETERENFVETLKTTRGDQVNVLCAKKRIAKGEAVGAGDVEIRKIETMSAPAWVIMSAKKAVGHRVVRDVAAGTALSDKDFNFKHSIVYVVKDVPEGSQIPADALEVLEVEPAKCPFDTVLSIEDAAGHVTKYGIAEGQILSIHDLGPKSDSSP